MTSKITAQNVQVYLRVQKATGIDNCDECLSVFGLNEVQISLSATKLDETEKIDVFKKREKLAYSPESGANIINEQRSSFYQPEPEIVPLQEMIQSQENRIFKFDRVFDSNRKIQNLYNDSLEKNIEDCLQKRSTHFMFNIGRSDTLFSYNPDEELTKTEKGFVSRAAETFLSKIRSVDKDNSKTSAQDKVYLAITVMGGNTSKGFDAIAQTEVESLDADLFTKEEITSASNVTSRLEIMKKDLLQRRITPMLVIYELGIHNSENNSVSNGKIIMIDMPCITEKQDLKADLQDCPFNVYMRTIYHLLTFGQANHLKKDKFMRFLSRNYDTNSKFILFANLQNTAPHYQQNMNLLNCLTKIYEAKQLFDSLFYHLLQQSSQQKKNSIFENIEAHAKKSTEKVEAVSSKDHFLLNEYMQLEPNKEEVSDITKVISVEKELREKMQEMQKKIEVMQTQLKDKDTNIEFLGQKLVEIGRKLYNYEKIERSTPVKTAPLRKDQENSPMTPQQSAEKLSMQLKLNLQSEEINNLRTMMIEKENLIEKQKFDIQHTEDKLELVKKSYIRLKSSNAQFQEEINNLAIEQEDLQNTCKILTDRNEHLTTKIIELTDGTKKIVEANHKRITQYSRAYTIKMNIMNRKMTIQQLYIKNSEEVFNRMGIELKNFGSSFGENRKMFKMSEITEKLKQTRSFNTLSQDKEINPLKMILSLGETCNQVGSEIIDT